jgi:lipoprotein-releasing system ATP-binding protein
MMGGLDTPSGGSVLVGGIDIYKEMNDFGRSRLRNSKMGFVFQFYNLLADFTVLENVVMPALMSKEHKSSKKQLLEKAGALLGRLGLSGRASHRPGQLSGGEAQRTAIARALMNDPEIMLCDEPTGNLDSSLGRQIYGILYELVKERQMSAVIITHYDHNWVKFDNIHVMRDGELAS